jgi:hypothetical protein
MRDELARAFLYESGLFMTPGEVRANSGHSMVVTAYKAADRIMKQYTFGRPTQFTVTPAEKKSRLK